MKALFFCISITWIAIRAVPYFAGLRDRSAKQNNPFDITVMKK